MKPTATTPSSPASLVIRRRAVLEDSAIEPNGIGKRKIVVTECYPDEAPITSQEWPATTSSGPPQVLITDNLEISYFTQQAPQERHLHHTATEIYTVQSGVMAIEVSGHTYRLSEGDAIVVSPGAPHCVLSTPGSPFLCQVIAANVSPTDKQTLPDR